MALGSDSGIQGMPPSSFTEFELLTSANNGQESLQVYLGSVCDTELTLAQVLRTLFFLVLALLVTVTSFQL